MNGDGKGSLTKADLVEAVRAKMGLPGRVASEVVEDMLEVIKDTLAKGEDVKISGFGNLEVHDKKARRGRDPRTGDEITISARRVVTFKPSRGLRQAMKDKT